MMRQAVLKTSLHSKTQALWRKAPKERSNMSMCPILPAGERPPWFQAPILDPEQKHAWRQRGKQLREQRKQLLHQQQVEQPSDPQPAHEPLPAHGWVDDSNEALCNDGAAGQAQGGPCQAPVADMQQHGDSGHDVIGQGSCGAAVNPVHAPGDTSRMKTGGHTFYIMHLYGIDTFEQWCETRRTRNVERDLINAMCQDKNVPGIDKMNRGKSTNTGSVAPLTLPGHSEILLKGLREHDEALQKLFQDETVTTAILWPGDDALLPSQLLQIANERTGGRLAVVAVDATWDGAMRMKGSYPTNVLQVKLGPESVLSDRDVSILGPVRRYRGDLEQNGRVSTLEAIAALLYDLHGDDELKEGMLHNLMIKVDAMLVQKLRKPCYGTIAASLEEESRIAALDRQERYLTGGARAGGEGAGGGNLSPKEMEELEELMRQAMSGERERE